MRETDFEKMKILSASIAVSQNKKSKYRLL